MFRIAIARVLAMTALFAVLPAMAATAVGFRVARPYFFLAETAASASPGYAIRAFATALLAACILGAALGLASLAAWSSSGWVSVARSARLVAALWIAAAVLYPGLGSFIPIVRSLPYLLGSSLMALVWGVSCLPRSLRLQPREAVFTVVAMAAFLYMPPPALADVRADAGRELTDRDILLLGFDSLSYGDVESFLRDYEPSRGTKVVFTRAATSVSLTGGAWRTVLSGRIPRPDEVMPGTIWPTDREAWLPAELEHRGYHPAFLQDDPTTNVYGPGESLRLTEPQGWQGAFTEMAWNVMFPLSTAGGRWWVRVMGGPAMEPSEFAYCPHCFMNSVLARLARDARDGPVFLAAHTCYAHSPTRLSLSESTHIPGWWWRTPPQFNGGWNAVAAGTAFGRDEVAAIRAHSVVELLRDTLAALDRGGVLGRATVIVLSDHGPRGAWVPREVTQNVVLTAFLPGERRDVLVEEPVSLADIAPTLRMRLGLNAPRTDGVPLSVGGKWGLHTKPVRLLSMRENPFDNFDIWRADTAQVRGLLSLRADGTFEIDRRVFGQIQAKSRVSLASPAR